MKLPEHLTPYLQRIQDRLLKSIPPDLPVSLREPIDYFLHLPGKKVRPLLTLFSSLAVGGTLEDALPAAIAVELFHDFTLIHDDIMDQDELRRGVMTLHVKYDESTAILAGDALIGLAYRELLCAPLAHRGKITEIFTEALVKVCEGQALDKEFETRRDVQLPDYLDMIAKKTAWLIQVACGLGAICGGGSPKAVQHLSEFGFNLGMGFQIQDDILDFAADEVQLGKKVGSDFRMHKTTYVTLKYREIWQSLPVWQSRYPRDIADFPDIYHFQQALADMGVLTAGQAESDHFIRQALAALRKVTPPAGQNPLYILTEFLQHRQY